MVATASTDHSIGCCLQPIGCSVETVATMIDCLPTQALAFSPVSIQTQRTQRKRLRLDGNPAWGCGPCGDKFVSRSWQWMILLLHVKLFPADPALWHETLKWNTIMSWDLNQSGQLPWSSGRQTTSPWCWLNRESLLYRQGFRPRSYSYEQTGRCTCRTCWYCTYASEHGLTANPTRPNTHRHTLDITANNSLQREIRQVKRVCPIANSDK